jgi:integrase
VQRGWVERHGAGWRGVWRDGGGRDGPRRHTSIVPRKDQAQRLLRDVLLGVEAGAAAPRAVEPITLGELIDRFAAQHDATPVTKQKMRHAFKQPRRQWGHLAAVTITPEQINRWLVSSGLRPSTRYSYLGALRQVYRFGQDNRLVSKNPARRAKTPAVRRSEGLLPFASWEEVEQVAAEVGRWAAFVILAADTGARPGELARLEHRHVIGAKVYLPGTKTRNARRIVTLTPRGVAAYRSIARSLRTPLVFHTPNGKPFDLHNWRSRVWYPALDLAGLRRRGPYQLRHTFAYFSLLAGVPIADLSVEMGHSNVALTFQTYGHWSDAMGDRAAKLRNDWAKDHPDPTLGGAGASTPTRPPRLNLVSAAPAETASQSTDRG